MKLNPYIMYNGQTEKALTFYAKVFGGEIVMMLKNGDSPVADHPMHKNREAVLHGRLMIGDQVLMASDAPPEHFEKTRGVSISMTVDTPAEAERVFKALSENGQVTMAMAETFFAHRFGMLVDQFDIPWMVNCEKKELDMKGVDPSAIGCAAAR